MATVPDKKPGSAVEPGPALKSVARGVGLVEGLRRLANRPWASGLAGFLTTVMVLLPIEYEAPLRSALLFLSVKRS